MPGPYGEAEGWGEPPGPLRTSGTASWSVAAGVLSFTCLFGVGGALAITLGWIAHNEIERAGGRLGGKGLASAGIGLGIANLVFTIVGAGALIALAVRPEPPSTAVTPRPAPTFVAVPPAGTTPSAAPQAADAPPPGSAAAPDLAGLPVLPPRIGKIAIVEASPAGDTLQVQLQGQLAESSKAGERLVLWTVTTDCEPCEAVARALSDARMQRALAKVRLFRADAASFPRELRLLGIPGVQVPGFTLLDAQGHALDYIHGGEWDADIPANIAPILDKFLRRSLTERRHPWARPLREGETPL
ncbi:MAG TPA: DUF4190 domain-containing protein [Polyangiaceae bacterium]|nr:DUF4190 domain-containing protein [Polyangiaceae bacterium]